jgi:hypothetical protein
VLPGARRLGEHGVVPAERELAALERVDLAARELAPGASERHHPGTPIS